MTQAELFQMLKSTGLPVTYYEWTAPPSLPYIVYLFADSDNFGADNQVYVDIENYQVELYSDKKDKPSEKLVEDKLKENEIYYEKSEEYIESEKMYQIIYDI